MNVQEAYERSQELFDNWSKWIIKRVDEKIEDSVRMGHMYCYISTQDQLPGGEGFLVRFKQVIIDEFCGRGFDVSDSEQYVVIDWSSGGN
jgi:hypothetical protein